MLLPQNSLYYASEFQTLPKMLNFITVLAENYKTIKEELTRKPITNGLLREGILYHKTNPLSSINWTNLGLQMQPYSSMNTEFLGN